MVLKKKDKARILIGDFALYWSIWTYRNSIVFGKEKSTNVLHVI
jgi:hypothetical protein